MHFFYSTEIEAGSVILRDQELQHLAKSLRARVGDEIWVLDGVGNKYHCVLTVLNKKAAYAEVRNHEHQATREAKLELVIAPTKNMNRMEWLVEKATEMGIHRIRFLETLRSERARVNLDRLRKIAISALKQSGNVYLPEIGPPIKLAEFVQQLTSPDQRFIAHCQSPNLSLLSDQVKAGEDVTMLIGPEGDFTLQEVELCKEAGFKEISLGGMRLRTETAGIFVTSMIAILNKY